MKNFITLRPHHFLCLPGYKGHSYSKEHVNSWDRISASLAQYPNMKVKIVLEQDTLCTKCPNNSANAANCNEGLLKILDEKVKALVGLKVNTIYKYDEIANKIKSLLNPQKHKKLCGDCHWRTYGLCKDTFKKLI